MLITFEVHTTKKRQYQEKFTFRDVIKSELICNKCIL